MAIAEIKVIPVGTDTPSISSYIAPCYRIVEEEGLEHQLTATSTIVEGDLDQLLRLAKRMHQVPFERGAARVVTNISIDERRDRPTEMEEMVSAVLEEV